MLDCGHENNRIWWNTSEDNMTIANSLLNRAPALILRAGYDHTPHLSSTCFLLKESAGPVAVSCVCLHVCFPFCSIYFMSFHVSSSTFVFHCQTLYIFVSVCQEVVWEAFKIFLDRLPVDVEYQHWMNKCQAGTISAREIGIAFSQSQEHLALFYNVCSSVAAWLPVF